MKYLTGFGHSINFAVSEANELLPMIELCLSFENGQRLKEVMGGHETKRVFDEYRVAVNQESLDKLIDYLEDCKEELIIKERAVRKKINRGTRVLQTGKS
jgi:stalled ribosome rescue protein Dom34